MNKRILNATLVLILGLGLASCSEGDKDSVSTGTVEKIPTIIAPEDDDADTTPSITPTEDNTKTESTGSGSSESTTINPTVKPTIDPNEKPGPKDDVDNEEVKQNLKGFYNEVKMFDYTNSLDSVATNLNESYNMEFSGSFTNEIVGEENIVEKQNEYNVMVDVLDDIYVKSKEKNNNLIINHDETYSFAESSVYDHLTQKKYLISGSNEHFFEIHKEVANKLKDIDYNAYTSTKYYRDGDILTFIGEKDDTYTYINTIYQLEVSDNGIRSVYYNLEKTQYSSSSDRIKTEIRVQNVGDSKSLAKKGEYNLDPYKNITIYGNMMQGASINGDKPKNYANYMQESLEKLLRNEGYNPTIDYTSGFVKKETGILIGSNAYENQYHKTTSLVESRLTIDVDSIQPSDRIRPLGDYGVYRDLTSIEGILIDTIMDAINDRQLEIYGRGLLTIELMPIKKDDGNSLFNFKELEGKIRERLYECNLNNTCHNEFTDVEIVEMPINNGDDMAYRKNVISVGDIMNPKYNMLGYGEYSNDTRCIIDISYVNLRDGMDYSKEESKDNITGNLSNIYATLQPDLDKEMYIVKKIIDYVYLSDNTLKDLENQYGYKPDVSNYIIGGYTNPSVFVVPYKAIKNESFKIPSGSINVA